MTRTSAQMLPLAKRMLGCVLANRLALSIALSVVAMPAQCETTVAKTEISQTTDTKSVKKNSHEHESSSHQPSSHEKNLHASSAQIRAAVAEIDKLAQKQIDDNVLPGLAIGIVHKDQLIFAKGFGLRAVGKEERINADTVFQLASISKPVASTVVARLVGEGKISWDSKISQLDPSFEMYDPWVTRELTIRDLFSHRSGLPDHAGDLLEDLGANRKQVLHSLRFQKPDSSFRSHYAYTNFGITEGGVAAARAYGLSWEDASEQKLYRPLGMSSTSSRYRDFATHHNKALGHVLIDGKWVQKYNREPDAQSPAGGVSSSVDDMSKWMRLQIANGKFEGKQIVDEKAIKETHHPCMLTQFNPFNNTPGFYGLGFNVNYDEKGRLRLSHSGAFAMGAATNTVIMPGEELGIIVLTNAFPIGVAEALAQTFTDMAIDGKSSQDWFSVFKKVFADPATLGEAPGFDYAKAPDIVRAAGPNKTYVGKYSNKFFGPMEIIEKDGGLSIVLGPKRMTSPMKHYNNDVFTYATSGENANGLSGITFTIGSDGNATNVLVEHLNECGEGLFERIKQ